MASEKGNKDITDAVPFIQREVNLFQTQNTFLYFKAKICVGKVSILSNVELMMYCDRCSHLGIAHLLYPQLEGEKPTTCLVPEPRNCAKTQAKECQEKRSAAVHGLCQSWPVTVEKRLQEGPLVLREEKLGLFLWKVQFLTGYGLVSLHSDPAWWRAM